MKTETITDVDGNVYNTVTIGTQVWMKKNLKVTHYRNGDAIDNIDSPDVVRYGRLYDWHAVNDKRGLAPEGWHVPTDAEWSTLTDYLIKAEIKITAKNGFVALPGGCRYDDGTFCYISAYGYWWTATAYDATLAWTRYLSYSLATVGRDYYDEADGFSVRCLKD